MDALDIICYILLIVLVLMLVSIVGKIIMKYTAKNRKDYWFFVNFIPRHIHVPDFTISQYYNRFPNNNQESKRYAMTTDDPFVRQMAEEINKKTKGRSDAYKAKYINNLVQQGYTYQSDRETYGKVECYAFPICTSYLHKGDCEDGALLGCSLQNLCGLDAVFITVQGHAQYAVNVKSIGTKIEYNNKRYVWCESTSILPMGFYFGDKNLKSVVVPTNPPKDYTKDHTYISYYINYK